MKNNFNAKKIADKVKGSTRVGKREDRHSEAYTVLQAFNKNKYYKVFKSHQFRLLFSNQSNVIDSVGTLDEQNKTGSGISEEQLKLTFAELVDEIKKLGSEFGSKYVFPTEKPDFVALQKIYFLLTLTYNFRYLLILKMMVFRRKNTPIKDKNDFVYPEKKEDIENNVDEDGKYDGFSLKKCVMIEVSFKNLIEDYEIYMKEGMVFPSNKDPTFKNNLYILNKGVHDDRMKFDGGIFRKRLFKEGGIIQFSKYFFKATNSSKVKTVGLCRELDYILEEYQDLCCDMFKITGDNKKKQFIETNINYQPVEDEKVVVSRTKSPSKTSKRASPRKGVSGPSGSGDEVATGVSMVESDSAEEETEEPQSKRLRSSVYKSR